MSLKTLNPELPYLTGGSMVEVASAIDALHVRTTKAIARLESDFNTQRLAIIAKWQNTPLNESDRRRIEAQELNAILFKIRDTCDAELDGYLKEAGALHAKGVSQRDYWSSPVMTLNRITLGSERRGAYLAQTQDAGPAEVAHLAQWSVSTGNLDLAAALVTRLDSMPVGDRPFGPVAVAAGLKLEEHRKAVEALKIIEARFQGIVIAIRSFKQGMWNPLNRVGLALAGRTLDEKMMKSFEVSDGR